LQVALNSLCGWVRASKHAPRDPFRVLKRRQALTDIVELGAIVLAERHRVIPPNLERDIMIISENASRHARRFAQHRLGFFEAL